MKNINKTWLAALGLCLLAACAPVTKLAEPTGGLMGPVNEDTIVGVWEYEVNGSCFLFQGILIITRDSGGLAGRLTERSDLYDARVQQRCAGRRTVPATILTDEMTFDGELLVFSGASTGELGNPFRVTGRLKVELDEMSGSLGIDGSSGNILRNEAATMVALREDGDRRQQYKADAGNE